MEPPMSIPKNELQGLHLIVVQFRDRRRNIRRTLEVAEILVSSEDLETSTLFRWRPRGDSVEKVDQSSRVFEDLNLHTGMTIDEIQADLKDKERIIQWMIDNKKKDIEEIGKIMEQYYKNPKLVLDRIEG